MLQKIIILKKYFIKKSFIQVGKALFYGLNDPT